MKKLTLNKKTIAQLDNPNKILGGELLVPLSLDAYTRPRPTCNNERTCAGQTCEGGLTCGNTYDGPCCPATS